VPATHDVLHQIAGPIRSYYRITRWLFGNDYNPFVTSVNDGLHPISTFVITNYETLRLIFAILPFMRSLMSIVLIVYLTQRVFLYGMDYYYLKVQSITVDIF
jgi:hypothetical protein